nr:MAG TPA: hypothetical protein [Caudoviricetes sp.]
MQRNKHNNLLMIWIQLHQRSALRRLHREM